VRRLRWFLGSFASSLSRRLLRLLVEEAEVGDATSAGGVGGNSMHRIGISAWTGRERSSSFRWWRCFFFFPFFKIPFSGGIVLFQNQFHRLDHGRAFRLWLTAGSCDETARKEAQADEGIEKLDSLIRNHKYKAD
jgi:hypothetical protein